MVTAELKPIAVSRECNFSLQAIQEIQPRRTTNRHITFLKGIALKKADYQPAYCLFVAFQLTRAQTLIT